MTSRPECPVCRQPVQFEVVNFVSRQVQQRVFQCGAVQDVTGGNWRNACPAAMSSYLAAEREIARLRELLEPDNGYAAGFSEALKFAAKATEGVPTNGKCNGYDLREAIAKAIRSVTIEVTVNSKSTTQDESERDRLAFCGYDDSEGK